MPQVELLKKISDTLGVLGLGELRGDIDGEIRRLKGIVEQGGIANEGVIMDIASTLLRVEDRLEHQLMRLAQVTEPETGDRKDSADDEDFQKVTESVMRECIINLARIKETISQSFDAEASSAGVDGVPSLIDGIKSGLLMLEKPRAMEVVDKIGSLVTAMLGADDLGSGGFSLHALGGVVEDNTATSHGGGFWSETGGSVTIVGTPLGSERRIAAPDGRPSQPSDRDVDVGSRLAPPVDRHPDTGRHRRCRRPA